MIDFDPFWGHDRDLTPTPHDPSGIFFRQLVHVNLGVSPLKLTWQVDFASCHLSSDLNRVRRRGWQVNLTSTTCQVWLDRFHLCPKHKCRTLVSFATSSNQLQPVALSSARSELIMNFYIHFFACLIMPSKWMHVLVIQIEETLFNHVIMYMICSDVFFF